MASKKNGATKKKTAPLPKGFREARQRLDGFFEREEGNSVTGILRGAFTVNGKFGEKQVFRIEVSDGETQVGDGEMIGPGGVIGLDSTGYTGVLADFEAGTRVYVRYDGLENPSGPPSKTNPHIFVVGCAE